MTMAETASTHVSKLGAAHTLDVYPVFRRQQNLTLPLLRYTRSKTNPQAMKKKEVYGGLRMK